MYTQTHKYTITYRVMARNGKLVVLLYSWVQNCKILNILQYIFTIKKEI